MILALRAARSFVSAVARSQDIIDSIIQLLGIDPAQNENQNNNGNDNDNGNPNQDENQANQNDGNIVVQPDNNAAVLDDNNAENPNQEENQANQNDDHVELPDINNAVLDVGAEDQIELRRQRRLRRSLRFLNRMNYLIARQFQGNL